MFKPMSVAATSRLMILSLVALVYLMNLVHQTATWDVVHRDLTPLPWLSVEESNSITLEKEAIEAAPTIGIDIIVGHCKEDIRYLDYFDGCNYFDSLSKTQKKLHFHIFSPCGGDIPAFTKVSECVTIHRSQDCGRETYSYFAYIVDRYDDLPDLVAFLQGSAVTENPHIVEDVLGALPTTSYLGLSRLVRPAWHMRNDTVRSNIQNQIVPSLASQHTWPTSWRSQFLASRAFIRSVPRGTFLQLMDYMCEKTCLHVQCALETWLAPLFGCADFVWREQQRANSCSPRIKPKHLENISWAVWPADYVKDGKPNDGISRGVTQVSCTTSEFPIQGMPRNQTLVYTEGWLNGIYACVEDTPQTLLEDWLWAKTTSVPPLYAQNKTMLTHGLW